MPTWTCEVVGERPDGLLTWRREGAFEPRGVLPAELVPASMRIGDRVRVTATRGWSGRWDVEKCERLPRDDEVHEEQRAASDVPPLSLACGQLRLTVVMNPVEDPYSEGKRRPAVLIADLGNYWRVMGLTTSDSYSDGTPRTPIPNFAAVGLNGPGYIWGNRLTRVRTADIGNFIGTADLALIEAIRELAHDDLTSDERQNLSSLIVRRSR